MRYAGDLQYSAVVRRLAGGLLLLAWLACCAPLSVPAQQAARPSAEVQALLDRGGVELAAHRLQEAGRLCEQGLQLARERKDRPGEAEALVKLSDAFRLRQPPQSLAYLEQALPVYRELGDARGEALCLVKMGPLASVQGQPQKAVEYLEAAFRLYQQLGDKAGQARARASLGSTYS